MKKFGYLLSAMVVCGACLFGCDNIKDHVNVENTSNIHNTIYTLTFDYNVSGDEAIKYAKKFGKELSKNGLDDFIISIETEYGNGGSLFYKDGKLDWDILY